MRIAALNLIGVALLTACSNYAPPIGLTGLARDELVARMGAPDMQRQTPTGTRLEFPRGPLGHHTWFVYLDPTGHATHAEQVLTEVSFQKVTPGMAQDEVRQMLGRASHIQKLGRSRGEVWSYRYENHFCQWFQVEFSLEQQVRSTAYGQPPECMGSNDVFDP